MYDGFSGQVICKGKLSAGFAIKTGVRQGCLLSPLLFLIAIDWAMRKTTEHQRTGIQWMLFTQLEDLDFTDDLSLVSLEPQTHSTEDREATSQQWSSRTQNQYRENKGDESQSSIL